MRTSFFISTIACAVLVSTALAQRPSLKVRNTQDKTVVMVYSPVNKLNEKNREEFAPNETRSIKLTGDDPFIVNHRLRNEQTLQWKVYEKWGVYLNKLAEKDKEYPLNLTFRKDNRGREVQVMSAKFVDPNSGEKIVIFDAPNTASDFVSEVIGQTWDTVRNAPDGKVDIVELDFGGLIFSSNRFHGELRQMIVGEDATACYVVGRWWLRNARQGDVYFTISKNDPNTIVGYCTLDTDGVRREYPWKSR